MQSAAKKILGGCAAFAAMLRSAQGAVLGVDYQVSWLDVMKMPVPLSDATASSVDQSIYIVGGCESVDGNEMIEVDFYACKKVADHILIYNVALNSWSSGADMPSTRYRHAAAVHNNYVYVVGGRDAHPQDNVVKSVLQYSTVEDKWTTIIANWADASSDNAAFVYGDHMYVCGGWQTNLYTATPKCHVMDLSQGTSFVAGPALQTARGDHRIAIHDGYAYCVGGFDSDFKPLASLEVLDLSAASSNWTTGPSMSSARGDFGLAVYAGRVLVMGGESGDAGSVDTLAAGASLRKVEAFDPATNAWLPEAEHEPIPHAVFRFCATNHTDRVFIFGGQLPFDNSSCMCYPTTDMVFAYTETTLSTSHAAMQSLWLQRLLFAAVLVVKAFYTA